MLESYLKSKKTWWGRIPDPFFDDLYFNNEIMKIFPEKEDYTLRGLSFQYILEAFKGDPENRIYYYFNKGNIFYNVSYAVFRVFQIIKGFFFGGGEDGYLNIVIRNFSVIMRSGEQSRRDRPARIKILNDKYISEISGMTVAYKFMSENMGKKQSVDSESPLGQQFKKLSDIMESFGNCDNDNDRKRFLDVFIRELRLAFIIYANLDPDDEKHLHAVVDKKRLDDPGVQDADQRVENDFSEKIDAIQLMMKNAEVLKENAKEISDYLILFQNQKAHQKFFGKSHLWICLEWDFVIRCGILLLEKKYWTKMEMCRA